MDALVGVHRVIHAGDVGRGDSLGQLAMFGWVLAVRGNVDRGAWAKLPPLTETVEVADGLIYVIHDVHDFDLDPHSASIRLLISGYSHQPSIREDNGVIFLNPGSARPKRFQLRASVARVEIDAVGTITARVIELAV